MKKKIIYLIFTVLMAMVVTHCDDNIYDVVNKKSGTDLKNRFEQKFYTGSDLSYLNEMLNCGATYKNASGAIQDPYQILKTAGNNLVRLRLWNNPSKWTKYSNIQDVEKSITSAKKQGMDVLLDFHYSDTWADPGAQVIPSEWSKLVDNKIALGNKLYEYTYNTLANLAAKGLLPKIVQLGNEININILNKAKGTVAIDWERNAYLLNKAIQAVRDISKKHSKAVQVMLHIAQPENALWWFEKAKAKGVVNYDWIGVSYYPQWSTTKLSDLSESIKTLGTTYDKKVMIVETGYPFTLENVDAANNLLGKKVYPATQKGQLEFLLDLKREIKEGKGFGLVYWEPAWVSTKCGTAFAKSGSHWDNATLFDKNGNPTLGLNIFNDKYTESHTCASIWALGDGVPNALWNWDNAIELTCNNKKNTVELNLAENKFRFFQKENDWNSGIGYQYFINRGFTITSELTGAGDNDDNFVFKGTAGRYKLEIDYTAKTISLEPIISKPYYALGGALEGGWDFNASTALIESPLYGIRRATIQLSPGVFRFFTKKGDWSSDLNYKYFSDKGYTINSNLKNDGSDDKNFKFTGKAGEYVLEVNDNNKTITLRGTGPFPSLWTVGDAVPGGWNFTKGTTVEFTSIFSGVWKANLRLEKGVFRFSQTFGTFDTKRNYAYYKDQGYTIDSNFENDNSRDKNFKFIGVAGSYTMTINANSKKITLEKYATLPSLWAVGDAVPGSWSFKKGETIEFLQKTKNVWSASIALSNGGKFRFFKTFGTWDTNNNFAYYEGDGYTIDSKLVNDGSNDKNFEFTGTTGVYKLTINANDKTITLKK